MKNVRFYISLYIIIPIIFTGISLISSIVAFRITEYYWKHGIYSTWLVHFWILIMASLTFICSLLIVRLFLRPIQHFIEHALSTPALSKSEVDFSKGMQMDELIHFEQVTEQVTDVLSKMDARQLFPEIIGDSRAMRGVLGPVARVAPTDATVLILGESGTGKELLATSIYEHSRRSDKPFVKLNCVAIPAELLESELFGHEKGAFTGAAARKPGKFELADGGSLFLDEIGDMPASVQAKILRVLQEREFDRVGGTNPVKVDVRFIAATNKNLAQMVREGRFREDLYYRLNVFAIHLPPLRERKEDIPLLVETFLKEMDGNYRISNMALQMLLAYAWPGNVRELKNTIERAALMSDGSIEVSHLPTNISRGLSEQNEPAETSETYDLNLDGQLHNIEKGMIIEALKKTGGVQSRAATLLGINQRSLWHRIKKYDIDPKRYKYHNS